VADRLPRLRGAVIARLIVISGPSGAGKGTLIKRVMSCLPGLRLSVSATTRGRRAGERHGREYYFLNRSEFERRIEEGRFLEWAAYTGNLYGTPGKAVRDHLEAGRDVILEIELEGAKKVLSQCRDAVMVYIMPPSLEELERRLRGRGTESEEAILDRLGRAKEEMGEVEARVAEGLPPLHYVIVNDKVNRASDELARIIERIRIKDEQADH